jgi:hypothetical protein
MKHINPKSFMKLRVVEANNFRPRRFHQSSSSLYKWMIMSKYLDNINYPLDKLRRIGNPY